MKSGTVLELLEPGSRWLLEDAYQQVPSLHIPGRGCGGFVYS